MTCDACETATPRRGVFHEGCKECGARFLSRSMVYAQAEAKGQITEEYRRALDAEFGVNWQAGHMRVKAWRMKECGH